MSKTANSITKRSVNGVIWMLLGKVGIAVLRIVSVSILARLLSPEDFGMVQGATIVIGFLELFSMFGIGPALVQFKELTKDHIATAFTITLMFGVTLAFLVWLTAGWIEQFFSIDDLGKILIAMAMLFPVRSISSVSQNLLLRHLEYEKITKAEFFGFLAYFVAAIVFAALGFRFWALVYAYYANYIIMTIILFAFQPHSLKFMLKASCLNDFMRFGSGVTLSYFFNYIAMKGDYIIIGRYLGGGALGLYGRAYNLMAASATLFGQVIDMVSFAAMSKKQEEPEMLELAFRRSLSLIALVLLPFSIFSILLAKEIIYLFLGPEWSQAVLPFQVLASTLVFRVGYKMSDALARAKGQVFSIARRHVVYAFAVLIGAFIGKSYGLVGISVGVALAFFLHFVYMTQLTLKILPKMSWWDIILLFKPALFITMIINGIVFLLTTTMRNNGLPSILVLAIAVSTFTLLLLSFIRFLPPGFWGPEGYWLLDVIRKNLEKRVPFLKGVLIKG